MLAQPDERHDNSAMTYEIELKLRFAPEHAIALQQALDVRATRGGHSTLNNTYFDTEQGDLSRQACALRIRQNGESSFEQTLKTRGSNQGGLSVRHEWNWPLDHHQLDTTLLASDVVRAHWPDGVCADSLLPLFSTNFARQRWVWQRGPSQVEVVLDRGLIQGGGTEVPLCELELELLQGDPADIWWMAETLGAEVPLWMSDISKAERGYRLLGMGRDWRQRGNLFACDADPALLPTQLNESLEWIKRALEALLWEPPRSADLAIDFAAQLLAFFELARQEPALQQYLPAGTLVDSALALTYACLVQTGCDEQSSCFEQAEAEINQWREQPSLAGALLQLGHGLWQWQPSGVSSPEAVSSLSRYLLSRSVNAPSRGADWSPSQLVALMLLARDNGSLTSANRAEIARLAHELLGLQLYQVALGSDSRAMAVQQHSRRLSGLVAQWMH
ncbi:inorganic triphosphatase [Oceanobacter sp. 3_MG-2023]|uniref:CYTH domain-containing protein n=1 Tax=Oceanobacter sp. 3_MG-2023 TaxID=3062622 RepID=UPI002734F695|nr:CYTH domain-containing protein [Oceanobacter sp. 3_MG-2023]MDP2504538.1 CYTH domain-containing protein [Oceanobacter sp. 3_MG-2023]